MEQERKTENLLTLLGWVLIVFGFIGLCNAVYALISGISGGGLAKKLPGRVETDGVFLDFHLAESDIYDAGDGDHLFVI